MENNILKLGKYKHYKGKEYEVIGVAKHSETQEELVVYRTLYGNHDLWLRPLKMFIEMVEIKGKKVPRFRYMSKLHPQTKSRGDQKILVYELTRSRKFYLRR